MCVSSDTVQIVPKQQDTISLKTIFNHAQNTSDCIMLLSDYRYLLSTLHSSPIQSSKQLQVPLML